jgi:hypothetical protein
MKPFQLTEDMQQEMVDGIKALADTNADDAVGPSPFAPSLRRRAVDLLHSEGTPSGRVDDTAVSDAEALGAEAPLEDPINPSYYRQHPSGVECIDIVEHLTFNLGTAFAYIWRAGKKNDIVEDLRKAQWYLDREIMRLTRAPR